jgi:DNA-binding CsgD family transcriptional regulator
MKELTGRPREVLVDAACGMQNKVIAAKYGITMRTVELHLAKARSILKSKTTTHAVARAIKYGIINPCEIAVLAMLCIGAIQNGDYRTSRTQPRPPSVRMRRQEDVI